MRPASIVMFERLWMAALLLGAVNMGLSWAPTLEAYSAIGLFAALDVAPRFGLAAIDTISLLLQFVILMLVARTGSRIARAVAIALAAWAVITVARTLGEHGAVPGARGMLATLCILLQVAGVTMLVQSDARRWFRGERA